MDYLELLGAWLGGAVIVVGIMQWIKGTWKALPSWALSIIALAVAIGAAFCQHYASDVYAGLGVWSVSQLAYELILQTVKKRANIQP